MLADKSNAWFAALPSDGGHHPGPSEHPRSGDALDQVRLAISEAASPEVGKIVVALLALACRHPEDWSHDESHALLDLARRLSIALNSLSLAGTLVLPDSEASLPPESYATDESILAFEYEREECAERGTECKSAECAEAGRSTSVSSVTYSRRNIGETLFPRFPWHVVVKLDTLIDAICIPCAAASAFIFFLPGSLRYQIYPVCIGLCSINVPYCFWIIAQFSLEAVREMVYLFESWFLLANMMVWIMFALWEESQRQTEMHNFLHACIAYSHMGIWAVPLAFIDSVPDKRKAKLLFCISWCFVVVSVFITRLLSPPNWHGRAISSISLYGNWYEFGTGRLIRAALVNLAIFTGKFAYRGVISQNAVVIRRPVRITWSQAPVLETPLGSDKVVPHGW